MLLWVMFQKAVRALHIAAPVEKNRAWIRNSITQQRILLFHIGSLGDTLVAVPAS